MKLTVLLNCAEETWHSFGSRRVICLAEGGRKRFSVRGYFGYCRAVSQGETEIYL